MLLLTDKHLKKPTQEEGELSLFSPAVCLRLTQRRLSAESKRRGRSEP